MRKTFSLNNKILAKLILCLAFIFSVSFTQIFSITEKVYAEEEGTLVTSINITMSEPIIGDDGSRLTFTSSDEWIYEIEYDYSYLDEEPFPDVTSDNPFENGKTYAIRIYIYTKSNYYFDDTTIVTVNGSEAYTVGVGGNYEFMYTINQTPSNPSNTGEPTKNKGISAGAITAIVIGAVLVVSLSGFATYWFLLKKRNFSELKIETNKLVNKIKGLFKKSK